MLSKKEFQKEVLKVTSEKNFKRTLELLEENKHLLSDEFYVKIVICCCFICTNKEKSLNINKDDLLNIIIFCARNISQLQDDLWDKYLRSVYHILKYFLQFDIMDYIEKMETVVLPPFWDDLVKKNHLSSYRSLCDCMHNIIAKLSKAQSNECYISKGVNLCLIVLKMYLKIFPLEQIIESKAVAYFKSLYKCPVISQLQLYSCFLTVIEESKNANISTKLLCILIKILHPIVENSTSAEEYRKLRECITQLSDLIIQSNSGADGIHMCLSLKFITEIAENQNDLIIKVEKSRQQFSMIQQENYDIIENVSLIARPILKFIANQLKPMDNQLTDDLLKAFCETIYVIGTATLNLKMKCNFCSDCQVDNNIFRTIKLLSIIASLTKSILPKNNLEDTTLQIILKYLKKICKLIHELKQKNCEAWKILWSEVGILFYNIAVNLYNKKSKECYTFWKIFIKNIVILERTDLVISESTLSPSLSGFIETLIERQEYKEALTYAAFNILKAPTTKLKSLFLQWIHIKSFCRDKQINSEEIQEMTVICALKLNTEFASFLSKSVSENLLVNELWHYKMFWPSKKPMKAAYRKLTEIVDTITCVKVLVKIWGNCGIPVHEEFPSLFFKTLENFKHEIKTTKKDKVELQVCLANLYVLQYDYSITELRNKNSEEMNNTVIPNKPRLQPYDVPPNPNDECDMISAYTNLNINTIQKIMSSLDQALEIYKKQEFTDKHVDLLENYKVLDLLSVIANQYELHNYDSLALQTWVIALKIAELMKDEVSTLKFISCILEIASSCTTDGSKLLSKASEIILKLKSDSVDPLKAFVVFYIQRSCMHLRDVNVEAAYKDFQLAKNYFSQLPEDNKEVLLQVKLDLLEFQFLLLPCDYNVEGHDVTPVSKLHQNLHLITSFIKEKGNNSTGLHLYFKTTIAIASTYRWLFLPREIRCYCREATVLAQKLLLPLVTSKLLILLSHADILSVRYDDCFVKLDDLSSILCLSLKRNILENERVIDAFNEITEKRPENHDLDSSFTECKEQLLSAPVNRQERINNPGSPEFVNQSFKMPNFISHESTCNCIYCTNLEYQDVLLQMLHLNALFVYHKEDFATASQFFKGSLHLVKKLCTREVLIKQKLNSIIGEKLFSVSISSFWDSNCAILLDYGYFLMRMNNLSEAKKINTQLMGQLTFSNLQNLYLQNEAVLQKSFILLELSAKENNMNTINLDNYIFEAEDDINTKAKTPEKTPESRSSKVVIVKSFSPKPDSPPKNIVKAIKFDLSEEGEKECINKTKNDEGSIFPTFAKTPIIARVHIPPSLKSVSKQPSPKLKPSIKIENDTGCCFMVPISPKAYTPAVIKSISKTDRGLRSKTKLLTEKLKTTVKNENNGSSETEELKRTGTTKGSLRKNLVSEMDGVVRDLNNLSVSNAQEKKSEISGNIASIKSPAKKRRGRPVKNM